jgi:hypothetical protein
MVLLAHPPIVLVTIGAAARRLDYAHSRARLCSLEGPGRRALVKPQLPTRYRKQPQGRAQSVALQRSVRRDMSGLVGKERNTLGE